MVVSTRLWVSGVCVFGRREFLTSCVAALLMCLLGLHYDACLWIGCLRGLSLLAD